ncbi:MAG: hypothetical protein QXF26_03915, partial [Candidatus Bathyarchaeia archaeon]
MSEGPRTLKQGEAGLDQSVVEQYPTPLYDLPMNLDVGYLVGIGYDGSKQKAFLKLYDPERMRIVYWMDDTGHKPYCLSKDPVEAIEKNDAVIHHPGFERLERVARYDSLKDEKIDMVKIVAKDPLSIGGRPSGSIRDLIKAWEADIKYVENYIYDMNFVPGMPYFIKNGKLGLIETEIDPRLNELYGRLVKEEGEDYGRLSLRWITLLESPV